MRPIPESYWVKPDQFLAGEYPGDRGDGSAYLRIAAFLDAGFNSFIDLTEANELPAYEPVLRRLAPVYSMEIDYARLPIPDWGLPSRDTMKEILETLDAALANGRKLYLHCHGGIGRTGTTVGCYLVRHGMTGKEALNQVAEWWRDVPKHSVYPRSPETEAQVNFILNWRER